LKAFELNFGVLRMRGFMKKLALVGMLAVVGINLGGCNDDVKKKNSLLTEENTRLRTENENLGTQNQQLQGQFTQLQGELANRPVNQPAAGPMYDGGADQGGGGSRRSSGGGGGNAGTRIEVAGDVLFDAGSVVIKAGGKKELDQVAKTIKSKYSSNQIRVEGYTDTDKPNKTKQKYPTNKALSLARARAVEDYLATKGISKGRMDAVGMGEANAKGSKSASRRVEIVILGR